jgi:Glycine/serine hydroxymethyltransferase
MPRSWPRRWCRRLRHHHRGDGQSSDAGGSQAEEADGKGSEHSLEEAGITCNKNGIPFDPEKPAITSGVRLGTPAATTRGFGTAEFRKVGQLIQRVLDGLAKSNSADNSGVEREVRAEVAALCRQFPIYDGPR